MIPSFATKLVAPYFIHLVPYWVRVLAFAFLSFVGMLIVAMSPGYTEGGTISSKIAGIVLASLSCGAGELSFVGLTHFYGPFSLAAWGSGTGAAGLIGAGAYALATSALGFSVHVTLLVSACLPAIMVISFFVVLPRSSLRSTESSPDRYRVVEGGGQVEEDEMDDGAGREDEGLLGVSHDSPTHKSIHVKQGHSWQDQTRINLRRIKGLFIPLYVFNSSDSPKSRADNIQHGPHATGLYRRVRDKPRCGSNTAFPTEGIALSTLPLLLPYLQCHLPGWSLHIPLLDPILPHP